MKYKNLTKEQIIISIDRLTRFKQTEEKYLRVYKDIILSSLIEPKYKKSELENFDYTSLTELACEIFNSSLNGESSDLYINNMLKEYENSLFNNDAEVQKLLNNSIDYVSALKYIDDNTDVKNLKWLKHLSEDNNPKSVREKYYTEHPIEKLVLVEGITEEILLPVFANLCSYNFSKNGIKIIAAGGKNQVVKLYYELSDKFKLPIFILLDSDALKNKESINKKLRGSDFVYVINSGEFEDLLPKELILKTINNEFKNFVNLKLSDLDYSESTVHVLEEVYKDRCLHEFKKADFANCVKSQIKSNSDISDEIKEIILKIMNL